MIYMPKSKTTSTTITKKITDLANKVHDSLPKGLRDAGTDLGKNIRETLQNQLSKLDMVTREEFDAQKKILERTQKKLAELEKKLQDKK